MKEFNIEDYQIEHAKSKAHELGILKNSIRKGEGNFVGFLGEECVSKNYAMNIKNSYDYDLEYFGCKFDVKTKLVRTKPQDNYECSVYDFNTKQKCDYYVFVRILDDFKKGWVLGFIPKEMFYSRAIKHKKGDIDTSNNFIFPSDAWNLPHSSLLEFDEIEKRIKSK